VFAVPSPKPCGENFLEKFSPQGLTYYRTTFFHIALADNNASRFLCPNSVSAIMMPFVTRLKNAKSAIIHR
jgi:hypothetical protein